MAMIAVPLQEYTKFKELKRAKARKALARRVELYGQKKLIEAEIAKLNTELFHVLRVALPDDVKSVEYEGHQVTTLAGSSRRTFQVKQLMAETFECPHCEDDVMVPQGVVDLCWKTGKQSAPTVSVKKIGEKDSDDGGDE